MPQPGFQQFDKVWDLALLHFINKVRTLLGNLLHNSSHARKAQNTTCIETLFAARLRFRNVDFRVCGVPRLRFRNADFRVSGVGCGATEKHL